MDRVRRWQILGIMKFLILIDGIVIGRWIVYLLYPRRTNSIWPPRIFPTPLDPPLLFQFTPTHTPTFAQSNAHTLLPPSSLSILSLVTSSASSHISSTYSAAPLASSTFAHAACRRINRGSGTSTPSRGRKVIFLPLDAEVVKWEERCEGGKRRLVTGW